MGDFDATIAAAGCRDTDITKYMHLRKKGRVPVNSGPKQQEREREHLRAPKTESGACPS